MSQTLSISTRHEHDVCDVCARTLLRGENVETFVGGGRRYNVCELCKPHALHEGWLREGTIPEFQGAPDRDRRRSLLSKLRTKGSRGGIEARPPSEPRHLDDELSLGDWAGHPSAVEEPAAQARAAGQREPREGGRDLGEGRREPRDGRRRDSRDRDRGRGRDSGESQREPRHVHAIPTSIDHKIAAALDSFNATGHTRTISGVARSLGAPVVTLYPDPSHPSTVWIVIAWELCWYRYEVDLSESGSNVRLDGQGYELSELQDHERTGNAGADDGGALYLF